MYGVGNRREVQRAKRMNGNIQFLGVRHGGRGALDQRFLNKRHENGGSPYMEKFSLFIHIDSQRGLLLRIWVKLLPVFAATRV